MKRRISSVSAHSGDDGETASEGRERPTKKKGLKQHTILDNPDAVDSDGFLQDIDVQSIVEDNIKSCDDPTLDIKEFFHPYFDKTINGKSKKYRKCKKCLHHDGIVADTSTCRRHLEAKHSGLYRKWCGSVNFESMLPGDVQARKIKATLINQTLDDKDLQVEEKNHSEPYSDKIFMQAAIEWLVVTDQPLNAFEHPKFKEMIELASRATNGVKIPGRKALSKRTTEGT
jgi:hypothetical protein